MSKSNNSQMSREHVRIKRTIILVLSLLSLMILAVLSIMVSRYIEEQQSASRIYGVWEEQNVPAYAQDRFEVREEGVYVAERVVDTRYTFNGSTLTYEYEGQIYEYRVQDEAVTELQRVAPFHYESVFYLQGSHPEDEAQTEKQSE